MGLLLSTAGGVGIRNMPRVGGDVQGGFIADVQGGCVEVRILAQQEPQVWWVSLQFGAPGWGPTMSQPHTLSLGPTWLER